MRTNTYFDVRWDEDGVQRVHVSLRGMAVLRLVLLNKGTAFTAEERAALGLEGLLPPQVKTLEQQVERVYGHYQNKDTDMGRYMSLRALQERNEILFYALLERHLEEMMPIVYTPTVGDAVKQFNVMYQNPRGISLSIENIDRATQILCNYPMGDVRMIVVTDSSAILGIGDQGYGGLAIPIGKLALYTVGGGVSPFNTMPVALDVGTDNDGLRNDPAYLGLHRKRLRDKEYFAFVDRFVDAVKTKWPHAVIQWEDLSKDRAFAVLHRYRDKHPSFNDDIQGTGAVALAGVLCACKKKGEALTEQTVVVHGAGAGGAGVAHAIRAGLMREGLSEAQARARVLVLDSRGLLIRTRAMDAYKEHLAQDAARVKDWSFQGDAPGLLETVRESKATVLLGLSGQPGAFDEATVATMAEHTEQPIIFPLSNPTSSSEGKPEDILRVTRGKAIVATGSPFDPVTLNGVTYPIGQGNNAFVFPGIGFGAILSQAEMITDDMILESAYALADYTSSTYLSRGLIYPPISQLREASIRVAVRVMRQAIRDGVSKNASLANEDIDRYIHDHFWYPQYLPFVTE